jgi:tetratricopeptide (TPR) repeat protein
MNSVTPPDERTLAQAVDRAIEAMNEGRFSRAIPILEAVLAKAPADYAHSEERDGKLVVRFWNSADFVGCVMAMKARGIERDVAWIPNAFPRAAYYLGYIAIDRGRFDEALAHFDRGLVLQPECAALAREKAFALVRLGRIDEAATLYETALAWTSIMTDADRASLLRGLGGVRIEQGRLAEAEAQYRASLTYEPESTIAPQQLAYIAHLRARSGG